MKEVIQMIKENPREVMISTAFLGLMVLAGLKILSTNQLSSAKEFMADPVRLAETCGSDLSGCESKTVTICDGNNTMFDFSDDVCESINYLSRPYTGGRY